MLRVFHPKCMTSATCSASKVKSPSSSFIFRFSLLPTRSIEIHQFFRNLATSISTSFSKSSRFDLHPEHIPSANFSSSSSCSPSSTSAVSDDPDRKNLRLDLYPTDNDPILNSIRETTSMQQIFDIFTSLQENGTLNEKHSSQCLFTLWYSKKKFRSSLCQDINPSTLFMTCREYIKIITEHPVFQSIIDHIIENYKILEDEPLSACLHIQIRFDYSIRHPNCQRLIEELLRRKSTLGSAALRYLCASLTYKSLYEDLILAELSPVLYNHARDMASDSDIRNVSIALRSSYQAQNSSVINKYRERLSDIWQTESSLVSKLEPATLCKIIVLLQVSLPVTTAVNNETSNRNKTKLCSASSLIRNYGILLAPHVSALAEMDIIPLRKVVLHRKDPVQLIEAISTRALQLVEVEQNPRMKIISCIKPRNFEQRIKLALYINNFMETCCTYNNRIWRRVLLILLKINYDRELFDKFWGRIAEIMLKPRSASFNQKDNAAADYTEALTIRSDSADANEDDDVIDGDDDPRDSSFRILYYANKYLTFVLHTRNAYSHPSFENIMYQEILQLLKNKEDNKIFLTPSSYAKCISFLVYMNHPDIHHHWSSNYFKSLKIKDLLHIQAALQLQSDCMDLYFISNALNKQTGNILRDSRESLRPFEYLGAAKLSVEIQRNFESCPHFLECMNKLVTVRWDDTKMVRELMLLVFKTGYYSPELFERASRFISELSEDVPLCCAEVYVWASYVCSADGLEGLPICAEIVKRNSQSAFPLYLLRSMLSFCYHGCLDLELINHVFDEKFLRAVDEQIKVFPEGSCEPMKIPQLFMELNRAVCIDKPEANVPWFHQKYCERAASAYDPKNSYLRREVYQVLSSIFGGHEFVAKDVYSPYYYFMDFLLQFDKNGNPMKPASNGVPFRDSTTKVAILLHNPLDFTRNIRGLKGFHRMKSRHLEKLGYQVIHIDPQEWNNEQMTERVSKSEYLESCIFKRSELQ